MAKKNAWTFHQRRYTVIKSSCEKMFKFITIRKMQIKIATAYYYIPLRMAKIKK